MRLLPVKRRLKLNINSRMLGLLFLVAGLLGGIVAAEEEGKRFEVYHSFGFSGMPTKQLKDLNVEEVRLYGHAHLWDGKNDPKKPEPNLSQVKWRAKQSQRTGDSLVTLDIEMWKTSPSDSALTDETLQRFEQVADQFNQYAPDVRYGFYGEFPKRNYWDPVRFRKGLDNEYDKWQQMNRLFQPLVDKVDVVMPSLYTFYDDRAGWQIYAEENLAEAKKYGKPIFVYLWPQYASSDLENSEFIDYEFWMQQLETVYEHADGVIIWSPKGVGHTWDQDAPWWQATVEFIRQKKLGSVPEGVGSVSVRQTAE